MIRVLGIGEAFEQPIEAGDAATIFGRSVPFTADVARIGDVRLCGADSSDGEPMLHRLFNASVLSGIGTSFLVILPTVRLKSVAAALPYRLLSRTAKCLFTVVVRNATHGAGKTLEQAEVECAAIYGFDLGFKAL
jgi:hypothetical protein